MVVVIPRTEERMSSTTRHHARSTSRARRLVVTGLAVSAWGALFLPVSPVSAATAPVPLAASGQFAVLAGAGVTNIGPTTITGDVGTFPTTARTGFGTVTLDGVDHAGDAVTQQAKTDLTTAYGIAAGSGPPPRSPPSWAARRSPRASTGRRPSASPAPSRSTRRATRAPSSSSRRGARSSRRRTARSSSSAAPRPATSTGRSGARRRSARART